MKRILVSASAVVMTFAMAGTAFAAQTADRGGRIKNTSSVTTTVISTNEASVSNMVGSSAATGGNYVGSGHGDVKGVTVVTGAATSSATVNNQLNSNTVTVDAPACGCTEVAMGTEQFADRGGKVKNKTTNDAAVASSNGAMALNAVVAGSTTGDNKVKSHHGDLGDIALGTGVAMGTTMVGTLANLNVVMVTR